MCGTEFESVSHVLWGCPSYNRSRTAFLHMDVGDCFGSFDALDSLRKVSFIVGNELWEENFTSWLELVKEFIIVGGLQIKTL